MLQQLYKAFCIGLVMKNIFETHLSTDCDPDCTDDGNVLSVRGNDNRKVFLLFHVRALSCVPGAAGGFICEPNLWNIPSQQPYCCCCELGLCWLERDCLNFSKVPSFTHTTFYIVAPIKLPQCGLMHRYPELLLD